jgi:molybdopterin-guanine dinucleotide biosynthesis protein A
MGNPVTCGIVAGGASSRMGRAKALLPFRGRPLLARQLEILRPLFDRVLVASNDADAFGSFGVDIVPDILSERCSLTAIHAVLMATRTEHAFVVACDLPFLNPRLVESLLAQRKGNDVVVPRSGDQIEPLHAVYSRACLRVIEDSARRGEWKVDRFFPAVRACLVPVRVEDWLVEGRSPFFNANTPAEWDSAAP